MGEQMPRPRDENPSPDALRMRERREALKRDRGDRPEPVVKTRAEVMAPPAPKVSGRLVAVTVWVPKGEAGMAETWAQMRRGKAGILESEVPS